MKMDTASDISESAVSQWGDRTSGRKVQSFLDKLNDVTVNNDGTVTHNIYLTSDKSGPREFKDMATFEKWRNKHIKDRKAFLTHRLTPH